MVFLQPSDRFIPPIELARILRLLPNLQQLRVFYKPHDFLPGDIITDEERRQLRKALQEVVDATPKKIEAYFFIDQDCEAYDTLL
jgi:hypothetical protein